MPLQTAVLQGGIALGTTAAAIYTVPAGHTAWVKRAVFTNTAGTSVNLGVTVTRAGGSPLTLFVRMMAASEAYVAPELASLALNAGDAVNAFAGTAAVVNVVLSGLST